MTPHPLPVPAKISKKGEQIPLFLPENVLHGHQQINMTQDLMKKKNHSCSESCLHFLVEASVLSVHEVKFGYFPSFPLEVVF